MRDLVLVTLVGSLIMAVRLSDSCWKLCRSSCSLRWAVSCSDVSTILTRPIPSEGITRANMETNLAKYGSSRRGMSSFLVPLLVCIMRACLGNLERSLVLFRWWIWRSACGSHSLKNSIQKSIVCLFRSYVLTLHINILDDFLINIVDDNFVLYDLHKIS